MIEWVKEVSDPILYPSGINDDTETDLSEKPRKGAA
jgi:hypothetical protein